VLDGITLHLRAGELVALIGASGAGKTSLLRLLAGHIAPTRGRLGVGGYVVDDDASRRWLCAQSNLKPQDPTFMRGTVAEVVAPGTGNAKAGRADAEIIASLRRAGLGTVLERGELGLDSVIETNGVGLSGGQRQMLALARHFHAGSGLLLLDEPTLGLDRPAQECVLAALGPLKAGRCVVVGTHATELIERADRILVLDRGRLVADTTPGELFAKAAGEKVSAQAGVTVPSAPSRGMKLASAGAG
jgi:ABC-type bacteriocin/lantibiotic exporter with double-glycine peptidase domain